MISIFNLLIFINLTFRILLNIRFQKFRYDFENYTYVIVKWGLELRLSTKKQLINKPWNRFSLLTLTLKTGFSSCITIFLWFYSNNLFFFNDARISKWSHLMLCPVALTWSAMADVWLCLARALKSSVLPSWSLMLVLPVYKSLQCQ